MEHNKEYLFYEKANMQTMKAPLKHFDCCLVGTKQYVFIIPTKSTGFFVVLNTFKTHEYFEDVSVAEGVMRLIKESENVENIESSLSALLEDEPRYVYKIDELQRFKFGGFLGKHTLQMGRSKMDKTNVSPKGRGTSKEFRAYYGQ